MAYRTSRAAFALPLSDIVKRRDRPVVADNVNLSDKENRMYNALDNQKAAADLHKQLTLEMADLRAAIDYNRATDTTYSQWNDEEDDAALERLAGLLESLKTYVGEAFPLT